MKQCTGCKKVKEVDEFYNSSSTKDGKTYKCKLCLNIESKKWQDANPEKRKVKALNWKKDNREKVNKEARERYARNPEHYIAKRKKYYEKNREKELERRRKYARENRGKLTQKKREWSLKNIYGITIEQFDEMLKKQKNKCAICKTNKPTGKGFGVDHNHRTGKIRGILCHHCNIALGGFKDSPELLREAISYLEKYDNNTTSRTI